jgi:hypothetical protein
MKIGFDFDNTIVSYDTLFHKVALEKELIPADLPANKGRVRDYLREIDREDDWTEMQGYVYGLRMSKEADAYPGVLDFFREIKAKGIPFCIVSHKTKHPFMGEKYDLHAAARGWLESRQFFDADAGIDIGNENVFFELTKEDKMKRIAAAGCTHFIDDLPEFLGLDAFPPVTRILFDPADRHGEETRFERKTSWSEISAYFASA